MLRVPSFRALQDMFSSAYRIDGSWSDPKVVEPGQRRQSRL